MSQSQFFSIKCKLHISLRGVQKSCYANRIDQKVVPKMFHSLKLSTNNFRLILPAKNPPNSRFNVVEQDEH